MQREVIDGIPFLTDKEGKLYYYDTSQPKPPFLGTKAADGTATLIPNWKETLADSLTKFRTEATTRNRK